MIARVLPIKKSRPSGRLFLPLLRCGTRSPYRETSVMVSGTVKMDRMVVRVTISAP